MRPRPAGVRRAKAGFTLVELLVALAILATLAAAAWRGVEGLARSREAAQAEVAKTLLLGTVLAQWEQDLLHLEDTTVAPALRAEGATLRLTRSANGGAQVVVWTLREGYWWRWAGAPTGRVDALREQWETGEQLVGQDPAAIRLLGEVAGWQLYFWRGNAWSNAQSSADLVEVAPRPGEQASGPVPGGPSGPSTTARERLPGGVRVVLDLPGGRLTRDLVLASQQP